MRLAQEPLPSQCLGQSPGGSKTVALKTAVELAPSHYLGQRWGRRLGGPGTQRGSIITALRGAAAAAVAGMVVAMSEHLLK